MSKYSALDAHSRNCPSCIRQRELDIPIDHGGHGGQGGHGGKDENITSRRCKERRVSGSRTSLSRRSNSPFPFSSKVGVLKKECSFDGYLTPTQRKNQEIKQIRRELAKANDLLHMKDKEITVLRREVTMLKESRKMNDSWTAQTGTKLENIDFELMETALKEEEETRHEEGNEEDELIDVRKVLAFTKDQYEDETSELKKTHEYELFELKKENSEKIEELMNELAESSQRCARQQDIIEQKQKRLDDILKELKIYKERQIKDEEMYLTDKGCQTVETDKPCGAGTADQEEDMKGLNTIQRLLINRKQKLLHKLGLCEGVLDPYSQQTN